MSQPNHILIIRLSALGDIAMSVPVVRVLSATYPDMKITVLSRKLAQPLFDDIPNVNFLIADVDGKHKGIGIIKLAKEAKSMGIDAVADLHNVIRSKILRTYFSFFGIKTAAIDKGRAEKKALTSGVALKPLRTTHQRYADVFSALNLPIKLEDHSFPDRKPLSKRLHSFIGKSTRKVIGIAPFAAYPSKMYPLDKMKEVIEQLDATGRFELFLFGAGEEEIKILKGFESISEHVKNVAGAFVFQEELELISNLDLMLAMDSSNGHLAAMFGIPVLTLWGVTHPYLGFKPFGQPDENQILSDRTKFPDIPTSVYGNKYPSGYEVAMNTIVPSEVTEKILQII